MNSLLQTLYMLGKFRHAVYGVERPGEVLESLQRIFYKLDRREPDAVRTSPMLRAFGWGGEMRNQQ